MSFTQDNPGFSASAYVLQEAPVESPPLPPSTGSTSSSVPLSGESSAYRNCPKCHKRMSKPVFDRHTVCVLCRGFECNHDSCCDECMEWSSEEMEAYVKHQQLPLCKDCRQKDFLPEPPSSPMTSPSPSQPASLSVAGVDDRIDAKLAVLSTSFDQKLKSFTSILLSRIAMLQAPSELSVSDRMSNNPFAAAQVVLVHCPSPGLDLQPPPPPKLGVTVGIHRELLADGVGPVPSDDRVPFPLAQEYVREWGSALSVDEHVPPVAEEVPALARARCTLFADVRGPPPVAETLSASFCLRRHRLHLLLHLLVPVCGLWARLLLVHPFLGQRRRRRMTMGLR